jgi:prepilin-type N-terminal cleavage/methylation domain-containing protein
MKQSKKFCQDGFTLIESMIVLFLAAGLFAGTLSLLRPAMDISTFSEQRGEMILNSRAAVNSISRELAIAGTGLPQGGIQLPDGSGLDGSPRFGCDSTHGCWLGSSAVFPNNRLYYITPGYQTHTVSSGQLNDSVTLAYRDQSFELDQYVLVDISADGTEINIDSRTTPAITNASTGIIAGDILVLLNANGSAAAVVTDVVSDTEIHLKKDDAINFNQPDAEYGNIKSLSNAGSPGDYPPTSAFRISLVTYFLATDPQLPDVVFMMRQVNTHSPVPIAEGIEKALVTYDIFDDVNLTASSGLVLASGVPNQIRKVNLSIWSKSPKEGLFGRKNDRQVITTSVGARNLSFTDRYN